MKTISKAIVLSRKKVSGADVLLTLLTREFGKKKFYVNGARHTKSKLSSSTQIFVEAEFSLYIKSNLSGINEAEILDVHKDIRENLNKFFVASYIVELVDKMLEEDEGDIRFYDFFSSALKHLNAEENSKLKLFRIFFLIKLLKNTGYAPNVSNCSLCSNSLSVNDQKLCFSPSSGGLICDKCNCLSDDCVYISAKTFSFINASLEKSYLYIREHGVSDNILSESDSVLIPFLEHHALVSRLKSQKILNDMGL